METIEFNTAIAATSAPKTPQVPKAQSSLSVSQLTRLLRGHIEADFFDVWVKGEISGFKRPSSGHGYFTLKDPFAQLKACIFRPSLSRVKFDIQDGMEVVAHGKITVYEARGDYQLVVDSIEPLGSGALQLAYEQLKKRLEKEGLFDPKHKKTLPSLPQRIGLVTSPTGAAVRDMIKVFDRRFPHLHVVVIPTSVQGQNASTEIVRALKWAEQWNRERSDTPLELLIVGRGGGSIEDLWAFNEEPTVRAIFDCPIPIISAVGHEVDFTLADFVADLRAPTPSAAAEMAVPNWEDIVSTLTIRQRQLQAAMDSFLEQKKLHLLHVSKRLIDPKAKLKIFREKIESLTRYLNRAILQNLQQQRRRYLHTIEKLDAFSPLKVLSRGYSLTYDSQGGLIKSIKTLSTGQKIQTRMQDGTVHSEVLSVEPS